MDHKLVGVGIGQRSQQDRVHYAENRGVGANAEGQRRDGVQRAIGVLRAPKGVGEAHGLEAGRAGQEWDVFVARQSAFGLETDLQINFI